MIERIRKDLEVFMELHSVSQNAIARALGINPSAISTFRKGEYKGNNEELARKIQLYIQNTNNKKVSTIDFREIFETNDKKMADFVINEAYIDGQIALITGEAGSGKSTIVKEYAKNHPNAILIEATLHTTAKVLLDILSERLHLNYHRSLHDKVVAIAKELSRRDCIVIIDEAEHLPLRALEDLRRIWDFSQKGFVLVGTEILTKNLMGKNGDLKQLYSRIDSKWHLRGCDAKECATCFNEYIFAYTKGNFRSSAKLFRKAKRLADMHNVEMSKDIVAQAATMIIL